jgi:hypothetical protein
VKSLICAAAVVAAAVFTTPAHATVCNLVTDPTGDAGIGFVKLPAAAGRHVDIVSADVASDATWVTTVVRLADLDTTVSSSSYWFTWWVDGAEFTTKVTHTPAGDTTEVLVYVPFQGSPLDPFLLRIPGTGTVDVANDEVRVSVRVADMAPYATVTTGDTFQYLEAKSAFHAGGGLIVDTTHFDSTYTAGDPSCVIPGS